MKFKAHINRPIISTGIEPPISLITTFSREWIIENIDRNTGKRWPNPLDTSKVICTYQLDKIRDKEDNKQFQITYTTGDKYILKLDFWNKFLCNWIHKRYVINKDGGEWFFKSIIAATIGFLFALIGLWIGYRLGVQGAPKQMQPPLQQVSPK